MLESLNARVFEYSSLWMADPGNAQVFACFRPEPTLQGVVRGKSRKVGKSNFPKQNASDASPKSDFLPKVGSPSWTRGRKATHKGF